MLDWNLILESINIAQETVKLILQHNSDVHNGDRCFMCRNTNNHSPNCEIEVIVKRIEAGKPSVIPDSNGCNLFLDRESTPPGVLSDCEGCGWYRCRECARFIGSDK